MTKYSEDQIIKARLKYLEEYYKLKNGNSKFDTVKELCEFFDISKKIKKRVGKLLEDWKDAQILLSLDGAGVTLVGRFLGEVETIDRFDGPDPLSLYSGTSPLPYSSGKYSTDKTTQTQIVNKRAKDAIMQITQCSIRNNPESRRYYEKKRKEGKGYWHAIKCLTRQLIRLIYAMLRDRTYY